MSGAASLKPRKDYSRGKYANLAIIKVHDRYEIGKVRDRWGPDLVKMQSFLNEVAFDMREAWAKLDKLAGQSAGAGR